MSASPRALLFPADRPHPLLAALASVVAVVTDAEGYVVAANPGFWRLVGGTDQAPCLAAALFANPRFADLIAVLPDTDENTAENAAPLFRGTITLLRADGDSRSIQGAIYRLSAGIACIGEHDADEYEHLMKNVLELNTELAENQRALLRANREIEAERARQAELVRQLTDAREQLMQTERLATLGQLAAGVAHEINNPLGALLSNLGTLDAYASDLLQLADVAPEALAARRAAIDIDWLREDIPLVVADMRDGLTRVRRIVDALRNLARPGEAEWQAVDLARIVEDTLALLGERLAGVRIERHWVPLPSLVAVPGQIGQVCLILLDNALRAIGPGGTIRLDAGSDAAELWFSVADDGCGIADKDRPHLFDPFFTTRPVGAGAGLGLYVAWGIVRRHGGAIDVESTPNRGSRFIVRLPLAPASPVPGAGHWLDA